MGKGRAFTCMAPHLQRGVSEKVLLVSALMSEIHSPTHGGILVTSKLGVASVHNMKFIEFQQQHLA